jgi:putative colanic acid biosynthesis UDP-glucose lipid carrier transferase
MNETRATLAIAFAPLLDGFLVVLSGWAAYFIRWDTWTLSTDYFAVLIVAMVLSVFFLPLTGAYQSWRGNLHWHNLGNAVPGLFAVVVMLSLIGTLMKTTADFSRLWMGYWVVLSLVSLFTFRRLVGWFEVKTSRGNGSSRRVLIVGQGEFARSVAEKLRLNTVAGFHVEGFIITRSCLKFWPSKLETWTRYGWRLPI